MAREFYVIEKGTMHEWCGKRCLPPFPENADKLDCAVLSSELISELEEMSDGRVYEIDP